MRVKDYSDGRAVEKDFEDMPEANAYFFKRREEQTESVVTREDIVKGRINLEGCFLRPVEIKFDGWITS